MTIWTKSELALEHDLTTREIIKKVVQARINNNKEVQKFVESGTDFGTGRALLTYVIEETIDETITTITNFRYLNSKGEL